MSLRNPVNGHAAGLDQLFGTGGTFAAYALSPPADSNGAESARTQDAAYPVNEAARDLGSPYLTGVS